MKSIFPSRFISRTLGGAILFSSGLLSCGQPGPCGGLAVGDELLFVANDTFEHMPDFCSFEEMGFYPGQEFRLSVDAISPQHPPSTLCRSPIGRLATSNEWQYSPMVEGNGGGLFYFYAKASHNSCQGELSLSLSAGLDPPEVSEQPLETSFLFRYTSLTAGGDECPSFCGGGIPGTVRKLPKQ